MIYSEKYRPRVSDFDKTGALSLEAILEMAEDLASHHSATAGDMVLEGQRRGVSWVLLEWRVEIASRPEGDCVLNGTTWVRGKARSSICERDMVFSDTAGNELIKAEAKLAMVDIAAGRFARIDEKLLSPEFLEERHLFDDELPRMRPYDDYDFEVRPMLRESDLDLNGHVHNTKYLALVIEALPGGAERARLVSSMRIAYLKPVKDCLSVVIKAKQTEQGIAFAIMNGELLCSLIEFGLRSGE
ncbi:MAG: hypothetical protein II072_05275 [Clostridia bacterium]|nr:hypothetical protein [Clostridia bacterium]MBQ5488432.1 hypothetical protein [Clostridia bacterium]